MPAGWDRLRPDKATNMEVWTRRDMGHGRRRVMSAAADRAAAWDELTRPPPPRGTLDLDALADLPAPAQRLLHRALTPGMMLTPTVVLEMEGTIRLKAWTPFRGREVISAGTGFVWEATAGKPPLAVKGGDTFLRGTATLDFRLWRLVPVARASGSDTARSAAGRLAAETVVWAPQALTPQLGATWTPIDTTLANVTLRAGEHVATVTVTVDAHGRLQEVSTQRWGNPDSGEFGFYPFGGAVEEHADFDGVTIATVGRVGWWWGTERQADGEFFRYRITDMRRISPRAESSG